MKYVEEMTSAELRRLADIKQKEEQADREGFLKHDLYTPKDPYVSEQILGDNQEFMCYSMPQIQEWIESLEVCAKVGASFVCIDGGWYLDDDSDFSGYFGNDAWAEKHLDIRK